MIDYIEILNIVTQWLKYNNQKLDYNDSRDRAIYREDKRGIEVFSRRIAVTKFRRTLI